MLEVPEGAWYKDFGSFKICGHGSYIPRRSCFVARLPKARLFEKSEKHVVESGDHLL